MIFIFSLLISQIIDATNNFKRFKESVSKGDEINIHSTNGRLYVLLFLSPSIDVTVSDGTTTKVFKDSKSPAYRLKSASGFIKITSNEDNAIAAFGVIKFAPGQCADRIWYTNKNDDYFLLTSMEDNANKSITKNTNICVFFGGPSDVNYTIITKLDSALTSKLELKSENPIKSYGGETFNTGIVSPGHFEFTRGTKPEKDPEFVRIMNYVKGLPESKYPYHGIHFSNELVPYFKPINPDDGGSDDDKSKDDGKSPAISSTLIIGIAVGGIVLVCIVCAAAYFMCKKRKGSSFSTSVEYHSLNVKVNDM